MANVRLALRGFVMAPVFTAVAVLSLALAIGANTALFGLLDQIMLQDAARWSNRTSWSSSGSTAAGSVPTPATASGTFSAPVVPGAPREERRSPERADRPPRRAGEAPVGTDRNEMVDVALVAGNFFDVFAVRPALGRVLGDDDDRVKDARRSPCSRTTSGATASPAIRRSSAAPCGSTARRSRWWA